MNWMEELAIPAMIAVALTAGILILLDNRRWMLATLAFQYLCAALLVGLTLPLQIAAAKLVAGLFACSIIALALANMGWPDQPLQPRAIPSSRTFRFIAFLLVLMTAIGMGRSNWMSLPGIEPTVMYGSTILIFIGLLQLGLHEEPVRVGVGLLTTITGFEVIYNTIEPSLAVIALLAAVHLGIALVVSYFLVLKANFDVGSEVSE